MLALRFDSPDALVSLGATLLSVMFTWVLSRGASVKTAFFWNGFLCLLSALVAFFVAVSPDLQLHWETGDAAFDELLGAFKTVFVTVLFMHDNVVLTNG